jgi:hypothetical protein
MAAAAADSSRMPLRKVSRSPMWRNERGACRSGHQEQHPREVVVGRVGGHQQHSRSGRLDVDIHRAIAKVEVSKLGQHGLACLRHHPRQPGDHEHTGEHRDQQGDHPAQRDPGVAPFDRFKRRHGIGDGLDTGYGGGAGRERAQHDQHAQGLHNGQVAGRDKVEPAACGMHQARDNQGGHRRDERVRRHREHGPRLTHPAHVPGQQGNDHAHADPDGVWLH